MTLAIKTSFSPGTESDEINRNAEYYSHCVEWYLKHKGREWGISLISGCGRIVFGLAQIVGSIAFFYLRSMHAGITYLYNRPLARLRLLEARRSIIYCAHGGVNIFRGILEALQIFALMCRYYAFFLFQCEKSCAFPYPSHVGAARVVRRDSKPDIELTEVSKIKLVKDQ